MRESGILMPVSSLPGPYGIGCFGKAAYQFVDFLAAAGQHIWQILPLSPTGYGDSPYQSCSAFAGNPYFIDLEDLAAQGLLTKAQLAAEDWGKEPCTVDYGALYTARYRCCVQPTPPGGTNAPGCMAASIITRMNFMHLPFPTRTGWRIMPCIWPSRRPIG